MRDIFMKSPRPAGFSLIELLLALSIIGVLAAFAIPAYIDYINRARFSEGMIVAKKSLEEVYLFYQQNGYFPTTNAQLGLESTVNTSQLSQVVIGNGGNVCAIFNGQHLSGTLLFAPTANGSARFWVDPNLSKYAPSDATVTQNAISICVTPSNAAPQATPTPTAPPTTAPTPSLAPSSTPSPEPSASASPNPTPSPDSGSWNSSQVYWAGDMVTYNGHTYKANWWTQGNNPATNNGGAGSGQPWTRID